MLDHVQRGRILEQPAGKDLAPDLVRARLRRLLDIDLHESAGLLGHFPGRGALAALHPDNDIADLSALAHLEDEILGNIVALVEQADCGDTVLVGCDRTCLGRGCKRRRGAWHGLLRSVGDLFLRRTA